MGKRLFDIVCAAVGLVVTAPLVTAAGLGIRLSSRGPVLHRARRAGLNGRSFTMYKLRTMRLDHAGVHSRVTLVDDPRVFPLGRVLRCTKIDELPQLVNVLRGEMSIVGPRPEDPDFVAWHYAPAHRRTLTVRPGLSSPGSLYHDTHGERILRGTTPEAAYVERLLPIKLALDLVYVSRTRVRYDLALIVRTLYVMAARIAGRRDFADPPEMAAARPLIVPTRPAPARKACASVNGPRTRNDVALPLPAGAGNGRVNRGSAQRSGSPASGRAMRCAGEEREQ